MPTIDIDITKLKRFDAPQANRIRFTAECSASQLADVFEEAWNRAPKAVREQMRSFMALQELDLYGHEKSGEPHPEDVEGMLSYLRVTQ